MDSATSSKTTRVPRPLMKGVGLRRTQEAWELPSGVSAVDYVALGAGEGLERLALRRMRSEPEEDYEESVHFPLTLTGPRGFEAPRKQKILVYNADGHLEPGEKTKLVLQVTSRKGSAPGGIAAKAELDVRLDKQMDGQDASNNPNGSQWLPFPKGFRRKVDCWMVVNNKCGGICF